MTSGVPRQGDVLRVAECGPFRAQEGSDLVVLFLGACPLGERPDVPAYLDKLGFRRAHAFEVTLEFAGDPAGDVSDRDWTESHVFQAGSPREALEGAVRFANFRRRGLEECELRSMSLCLMRMGPIGPEGKPHNGRGRTFASWSSETCRPLEDLLDVASPGGEDPPPGT